VPQTISPEAQRSLARQATPAASHEAPSQPKKPQPVQTRQMSSDATQEDFKIKYSMQMEYRR
jgi:hypothetical protein